MANREYDPNTAIRAQGEKDRSPELKASRRAFVEGINGFLAQIAEVQEKGGDVALPGGMHVPIKEEPRITETNLGMTPRGFRSVAVNKDPGVSLHGDGETSPRVFQAVLPDVRGGFTVIEITGTDPMLPKTEEGGVDYGIHNRGTTASLKIESSIPSEDGVVDSTESYTVQGTGAVGVPRTETFGEPAQIAGMQLGLMIVGQLKADLIK